MPKPGRNEQHAAFVARCIPVVVRDGTAKDGAQGQAICESIWKEHEKMRASTLEGQMAAPEMIVVRAAAEAGELRSGRFDGRDHLIVPIVALIGDSVIRPVGSEGQEYVPAEEIAKTPKGWDGRPILPDHPAGGNAYANTPETLDAMRFGSIFNTRFEDGRLKMEAWLDPERAAVVGAEAAAVVEALRAGKMLEVSVGCFVSAEKRTGTASDGTVYEYVWHDIVPDHLAVGLGGKAGACSVEMGCGTRAAIGKRNSNVDLARIQAMHDTAVDLGAACEAYTTKTDSRNAEDSPLANPRAAAAHHPDREEEPIMSDVKKQLVGRLIAAQATPFTSDDEANLGNFSEERLTAMCDCVEKLAAPAPVADAEPAQAEPEPPLTEAEWLAKAPEPVRELVAKYQREEEARRGELVSALKAAQSEFGEEALKAKPTAELHSLAKLLKLGEPKPDFSGRVMPQPKGADEAVYRNPPSGYAAALAKNQKAN